MKKIPRWFEYLALGLALAFSTLITVGLNLVIPAFEEVFRSFGAELPLLAVFYIRFRWSFLALPVLVLIAWRYWPNPNARSLAAVFLGIVIPIVLLVVGILAMYLPIYDLRVVA
jgi:type II secretory pathway component PulF